MSDDPHPDAKGAEADVLPYFPTTMVVDAYPVEEEDPGAPEVSGELRQAHGSEPVARLLMGAFGFALARPRVLLFLLLISLLLPLAVAVPAYHSAEAHLSGLQPVPGGVDIDLPRVAPSWVFDEWQRATPGDDDLLGQVLAPLLLLASLLNLFLCAGWMMSALTSRRGHSLRIFLQGGGRFFFPFLRSWLLGLPLFALVTWIYWGVPAEWLFERILPEGDARMADSETTGRWLETLRSVLYLLSLWKVEILLDLARASLVAGRRSSAFVALFRGGGLFLRRPFALFGLTGLAFAVELIGCGAAEALRRALEWPLWTLLMMLPFVRNLSRGARYVALVRFYELRVGPAEE